MANVIDKSLDKIIRSGLEVNSVLDQKLDAYILPSFEKNEDGEYVYVGEEVVNTIEKYNDYSKKYSEIMKIIKKNYQETIYNIFKNALNSLICVNEKSSLKTRYSAMEKMKNGFTVSNIALDNSNNLIDTLNFVTKAAYKTKKLKPSKEILEIMHNSQKDFSQREQLYVLPRIGDNGVMLVKNKSNSSLLEARFELYSQLDAMALENFMLETAGTLDLELAGQLKAQIYKIFTLSKKVGFEVVNSVDNETINNLQTLTKDLVELVGADLSTYNKKVAKNYSNAEEKHVAKEITNPDGSTTINGTDAIGFNASEILIKGTFKTAPAIDGDVIVTKITPEGVKFDVVFDGDKLFVQTANYTTNEKPAETKNGLEM